MVPTDISGREIIRTSEAGFEPFDQYGRALPGLSWLKLNYNAQTVSGTYLLRFAKGAASLPHIHSALEEFIILEGELVDSDGAVFRKGDFIRFAPGTQHHSVAPQGCLILVFLHGRNVEIEGSAAPQACD
jgi:anti-sigma factor ChrR (cupin superfamily)